MILILYVDDLLIVAKNKDELSKLKKNVSQTFDMKDLGNAKHILGMRITRDRSNGCIYLSQVYPKYSRGLISTLESAKP